MKTILITGGLGFIGSHFTSMMVEKHPDWEVVVVDKLTYAGTVANLSDEARRNINWHQLDINDSSINLVLQDKYRKPDVIVHFAAESAVDKSINSDAEFWKTNVLGTANLLRAYKNHCPEAKMIHINSDECYGSYDFSKDCHKFLNLLVEKEIGYTEDQPYTPSSPYAASKAASQLVVDSYCQTYELDNIISLFCTNNYGPNQLTEKLIPRIITNALRDEIIPIYGEGLQQRDWLFVEDFCLAIEKVVLYQGNIVPNAKFNISAGNEKQNIEVVKDLLTKLGKSEKLIEFINDPRPGNSHDFRYYIDSSRFREEFGWKTEVMWDAGLDRTIKYYESR